MREVVLAARSQCPLNDPAVFRSRIDPARYEQELFLGKLLRFAPKLIGRRRSGT
jgi:hypothetical protein